jgi:polar amino acid transport system permease protein
MQFDFGPVIEARDYLAWGLVFTVALAASTAVLSTILGTAIALLRIYGPRILHPIITFYVDSIRAMPVMAIMVWVYFAVPVLTGINMPAFWAALLSFTMQSSAYMSEIARAGIVSIRVGQTRAGLALGMSRGTIVRHIILPQAAVRILPSYGSMMAMIIKDTAVSSIIAVPEYLRHSSVVAAQSYHPIEVYSVAMVVFFMIIFPVSRCVDLFYRRVARLGRS